MADYQKLASKGAGMLALLLQAPPLAVQGQGHLPKLQVQGHLPQHLGQMRVLRVQLWHSRRPHLDPLVGQQAQQWQ